MAGELLLAVVLYVVAPPLPPLPKTALYGDDELEISTILPKSNSRLEISNEVSRVGDGIVGNDWMSDVLSSDGCGRRPGRSKKDVFTMWSSRGGACC